MMPATLNNLSVGTRVALIAALWLASISWMHAALNSERTAPETLRMGYMPVVTNLAAPLIDHASRNSHLHFEAVKFASFAEMAEAFRAGHIQAAFIIAPLAIALHQQGVPLKVVYIGNRHESTLVTNKSLQCNSLTDMIGKTIAVPIRYSGHLLALRRCLRERGLSADSIRTVEIPPPDMPVALASGGVDGYFVGEPFASKSLWEGSATRLLDVEQVWPNFICNLMIVREDLIASKREQVQSLVSAAARSGFWARENPDEMIRLVSQYWGQDPEFLRHVFGQSLGRFRFDLFIPIAEEMEEISREMALEGLMEKTPDIREIIEDSFAKNVKTGPVESIDDIVAR